MPKLSLDRLPAIPPVMALRTRQRAPGARLKPQTVQMPSRRDNASAACVRARAAILTDLPFKPIATLFVERRPMNILQRQFAKLVSMMQKASEPVPADLPSAIRGLPAAGKLPFPGSTWLLIVLIRYHGRQRAAKEMLLAQLPGRFPIPPGGPGLPEGMPLPGKPVWEIGEHFGPDWGAIHNKVTGEWISVSTTSLEFDRNVVFPDRLPESVRPRSSWSPEGRFLISDKDICGAIDDLVGARVLQVTDSLGAAWNGVWPPAYVIDVWALSAAEIVQKFRRQWQVPERRLWLAALIGDWSSARELAENVDDVQLKAAISERFQAYREYQLADLRDRLDDDPQDHVALKQMQDFAADDFLDYAHKSLRDEERMTGELQDFLAEHR